MRERWAVVRRSVRGGFWALPTLCVVSSILLALGTVRLDHALSGDTRFSFGAGPDGAREVLSDITTAMITFTGLVFSITVVVLQLTSSQFSPRALRTFLRDRQTQLALGVFIATFVYSILVLRTVDAQTDSRFVPSVATTVALVLLLTSVAVFVMFIHHITSAIQVSSIVATIGREARGTIERRFPADRAPDGGAPRLVAGPVRVVVCARHPGVVTGIDDESLVELARTTGTVVRTRLRLGDFVPEGAPLLEVLGEQELDVDMRRFAAAVQQHRDRTMDLDVAFGFRQLVDVAERALSPAVNDPTTAVQALDQVHELLRRLATRTLDAGWRADVDDVVRLVRPPENLAHYLTLALEEIEQYGVDAPPVRVRLDAILEDLQEAALPQHRAAVADARRRWRDARLATTTT